MAFCLPVTYDIRKDHVLYNDVPNDLVYQPQVYQLVEYLANRASLKFIIDIGCGSASKLVSLAERFSIIGIDSEFGVDIARKNIPSGRFIVHDLETGLPLLSDEILSNSIVLCSDVIEHLRNPDRLMSQLAELSLKVTYVVVSTPDRDRVRGWLDNGPPANPSHVMEWNGPEFIKFMFQSGFVDVPFYGHTINTEMHRAKTTLIAVSGAYAWINRNASPKKIAAIIHAYNEVDILPEVIRHLVDQGVEVHYFDNWSKDGSWEIAQQMKSNGFIKNCERFPEYPNDHYEWHLQLAKTSEYARTLDADWIMHHDADEIRLSPWRGVSLSEAIASVDSLGFNSIDFTVIDFRFIESRPTPEAPYQDSLNHFEFGRRPGHFSQVKCWKNGFNVDLASSGGHHALFPDQKIYPIKFLLKHYPLRTKEQAQQKIFRHRLPRFGKEKEQYGWHVQYDCYEKTKEVTGWGYYGLSAWHPIYFANEFLIERISGIGIVEANNDTDQNSSVA